MPEESGSHATAEAIIGRGNAFASLPCGVSTRIDESEFFSNFTAQVAIRSADADHEGSPTKLNPD